MMNLGFAIIKDHARLQMQKRGVPESEVRAVLNQPEAVLPVRTGRVVAQTVFDRYMIRVFVDIDRDPNEVVTAYRTSKIDKYRS